MDFQELIERLMRHSASQRVPQVMMQQRQMQAQEQARNLAMQEQMQQQMQKQRQIVERIQLLHDDTDKLLNMTAEYLTAARNGQCNRKKKSL